MTTTQDRAAALSERLVGQTVQIVEAAGFTGAAPEDVTGTGFWRFYRLDR